MSALQAQGVARQLQQAGPDGTIAILIIVIVVFMIIWGPSTIRRCRNRINGESADEDDASRSRLADVYLEAVIMRRLAELNRFREQHVQHQNMSEADRREYIRNVLLTRRVVIDEPLQSEGVHDGRSPSSHSKADDPSVHLKPISKSDTPEDDENCCAICLNEYKSGDEVCFSNNKFCNHFFHRDCISEWLVTHEECPCCRHFFLFFVENDRDLEMYERRPHRLGASSPPGPVAALASTSTSSPQSRDGRPESMAQGYEQQTIDVNAEELPVYTGQSDLVHSGTTHESLQSTPSASATLPVAISTDALPEASDLVLARGMDTLDRLQRDEFGANVNGQSAGPTGDPARNLEVPVALAGGQREPSV